MRSYSFDFDIITSKENEILSKQQIFKLNEMKCSYLILIFIILNQIFFPTHQNIFFILINLLILIFSIYVLFLIYNICNNIHIVKCKMNILKFVKINTFIFKFFIFSTLQILVAVFLYSKGLNSYDNFEKYFTIMLILLLTIRSIYFLIIQFYFRAFETEINRSNVLE